MSRHVVHNGNNKIVRRRDIFKDHEYNWCINLSKKLKRIFSKFCSKYNLKSQKHYKIDWISIALNLGQVPSGPHKWNLDHIKPISQFNFQDEKQIYQCWSIDNLCFLPKVINYEKADSFPWTFNNISNKIMKKLTKEEKEFLEKNRYKYEQKDTENER